MKTRNITVKQLETALENINRELYDNNIKMDIREKYTSGGLPRHSVKVGVHSSHKVGGSYNPYSKRHIAAACWHVFGHFLDELGEICDNTALVELMDYDYKTRVVHPKDHDWLDLNVGSNWYPMYQSEKCYLCYESGIE